jgi:hypothetical protein
MGRLSGLCGATSGRLWWCSHWSGLSYVDTGLGLHSLGCSVCGLEPRNSFDRRRYPAEPPAEIGDVDERKQQCRYPERMDMSEQGEKAQHGYNFELQPVGSVRHALGQRVQAKEHNAK